MTSIDLNKWDQDFKNQQGNQQILFHQIKEAIKISPSNIEYLCRASEITICLANHSKANKHKAQEKSFIVESLNYAKKAIESDPQFFRANKMYCLAVGRMADFVGIKEKIRYGHEFKKHSEIAFALNTSSVSFVEQALLYHMYGRFAHQIASLSWIEKKLASTIFGEVPEATYEEALEALQRADSLREDWICNKLWISKVLISQKKYGAAIQLIDSALNIEYPYDPMEISSREELIELKAKYA